MDKSRFLRVANRARRDFFSRSTPEVARCGNGAKHFVDVRFTELAKDLNKAERLDLVDALKASLEKERRRCLGRKNNYDPGRHISLYIAIKTLMSDETKPPE